MGGGGTGQPGGGVKDEGEGEVVVDEGNGDGEEGEGVEVVDPPHAPPPLLLKALGLQSGRRGRSAGQPRCSSQDMRGISLFFPPPRIAT